MTGTTCPIAHLHYSITKLPSEPYRKGARLENASYAAVRPPTPENSSSSLCNSPFNSNAFYRPSSFSHGGFSGELSPAKCRAHDGITVHSLANTRNYTSFGIFEDFLELICLINVERRYDQGECNYVAC